MKGGIRIISDGTPNGTRVLDAKGDMINGITKIEISPILPNGLVRAVLHFVGVELDVDAVQKSPPSMEEVARVEALRCNLTPEDTEELVRLWNEVQREAISRVRFEPGLVTQFSGLGLQLPEPGEIVVNPTLPEDHPEKRGTFMLRLPRVGNPCWELANWNCDRGAFYWTVPEVQASKWPREPGDAAHQQELRRMMEEDNAAGIEAAKGVRSDWDPEAVIRHYFPGKGGSA